MKKIFALAAILVIAGASFAQGSDKFTADFEQAERLLSQKNYKQAYNIYSKMVRQSASRGFAAEIKYRTAQCAFNLGRFETSISLLEEVLNKDIPSDSRYLYLEPQVKFSLGLCYFQIGDNQRAGRLLDEAQSLGGQGIADYLIRADYKKAFDHLQEKEYPVDKLFLARSLINSKDPAFFSDILSLLTELSEDVNLEELVDFSRAEMQFFNQDYATSKNVFHDFLLQYPQTTLRPFAEYYLACTYYHEGQYRYAIDQLGKLTDPNKSGYVLSAHAYFMRGEAYRKLDLPDSAMFSFEQARIVAPNSMVDFYTTYKLYDIARMEYKKKGDDLSWATANREAKRLGGIALSGRDQRMMENLSDFVQGNIQFDENNYREALNFYQRVTLDLPSPTSATEEELLIYEGALTMEMLSLNRQNNRQSYNAALAKPQMYLTQFGKRDSVALKYGGDWRAYLLYNAADATYYSAYRPKGDVTTANLKRREEAQEKYQNIVDKYPYAYVATLAKVSLAWYKLEASRFDEALADFSNIFENTFKKDALVLAAYGKALSFYYKGDYTNAGTWFFSEDDYKSVMSVATSRDAEDERIRYNEIADSLIDKSLFWRGKCLEQLGAYGDALATYQHIADDYSSRPKAGEAWRKIIEFYIRAQDVTSAEAAVEQVKSKMTRNPRIYKDPYGYGLAALLDYYQGTGDEATAENYAKLIVSELRTTDPIEQIYYVQGLRDTSVVDIADLKDKIEKIRSWNNKSQYLPDLMYNLGYLLYQQKSYTESKEVLVQLKNWPDVNAIRDILPEITYQLALVYHQQEAYKDVVTQMSSWLRYYETGDNARPQLAPNVNYFLALAYFGLGEDKSLSPQERRGYFRKALGSFEKIKSQYADTDFYKAQSSLIDRFISRCKKEIG